MTPPSATQQSEVRLVVQRGLLHPALLQSPGYAAQFEPAGVTGLRCASNLFTDEIRMDQHLKKPRKNRCMPIT